MAYIDNLVASITDPILRGALEEEVRKLTDQRQFGLVFNEHKPESVVLHKQTQIRRGDKVHVMRDGSRDRTQVDDSGVWVVQATMSGTAHLQHKADAQVTRQEPVSRCVVVREFGDPIYPGLRLTKRLENGGDRPFHAVIRGENFHTLQALKYPHAGEVDAVYIDPPYNTGARDWKYNNDYVDDTDPYRHSKWLSFMEKRLNVAKDLLNPNSSVLIVTIDEKEVHHLGMLLDKVYRGVPRQMVTIVINPNGVARGRELARVEEYAFFLFLGEAAPAPVVDSMLNVDPSSSGRTGVRWERLMRGGSNSRRQDRPNLFYPVYVDPEHRVIVEVGEPIPATADRSAVQDLPGLVTVWPVRSNGEEANWRTSSTYLRELLKTGHARVGAYNAKNNRWSILYLGKAQIRRIEEGQIVVTGRRPDGSLVLESVDQEARRTAKTVWNRPSHKAGEYGSALVKKFTGNRSFPFPKSLYAVEDALRVAVGDKPDALVVDFFAGSGTTAHAVMRLNHQDGGTRRSIIITNNEVSPHEAEALRAQGHVPGDPEWEKQGICEYITIPRMIAAVTGKTRTGRPITGEYKFHDPFPIADGLHENVEFFELTYEDAGLVSLGRKFQAIAPLLWMMAGAQGARIDTIDAQMGWSIPDDANYGVLFDPQTWSDFMGEATRRANSDRPLSHAFVVTDAESEYRQIISKLPNGITPHRLYSDYLRSFEINIPD